MLCFLQGRSLRVSNGIWNIAGGVGWGGFIGQSLINSFYNPGSVPGVSFLASCRLLLKLPGSVTVSQKTSAGGRLPPLTPTVWFPGRTLAKMGLACLQQCKSNFGRPVQPDQVRWALDFSPPNSHNCPDFTTLLLISVVNYCSGSLWLY